MGGIVGRQIAASAGRVLADAYARGTVPSRAQGKPHARGAPRGAARGLLPLPLSGADQAVSNPEVAEALERRLETGRRAPAGPRALPPDRARQRDLPSQLWRSSCPFLSYFRPFPLPPVPTCAYSHLACRDDGQLAEACAAVSAQVVQYPEPSPLRP